MPDGTYDFTDGKIYNSARTPGAPWGAYGETILFASGSYAYHAIDFAGSMSHSGAGTMVVVGNTIITTPSCPLGPDGGLALSGDPRGTYTWDGTTLTLYGGYWGNPASTNFRKR